MLRVEVLDPMASFWNIGVLLFDTFKLCPRDSFWQTVLRSEREDIIKVRGNAKWMSHTNTC